MKAYNWNPEKNQQLIRERGLSLEDVLYGIESGSLLDDLAHPNAERYPGQRMLVVAVDGYACLVPYVETETELFLKTIIPSRKATKQYLGDAS